MDHDDEFVEVRSAGQCFDGADAQTSGMVIDHDAEFVKISVLVRSVGQCFDGADAAKTLA